MTGKTTHLRAQLIGYQPKGEYPPKSLNPFLIQETENFELRLQEFCQCSQRYRLSLFARE
jgi:hypothetical protein